MNEKHNDKSKKRSVFREMMNWSAYIVAPFLFAMIINNVVIVNAYVPTGSMLETIQAPGRIVAYRLAYAFSEPQRFDVVVFKFPDDETQTYVKRIIGMPGDTLYIKDGEVYVNGSAEPLRDDFVTHPDKDNYGPVTVPEGYYFMLGDNRINSEDSRRWVNTFVAEDKILGKVIFSYYPSVKLIK